MKRYIKADDEFFDSWDDDTRLHLAEDPNTDPNILQELAKDYTSVIIREFVARNPNTPIPALKRLARDGDEEVRSAVAYNKNTTTDILKKLATDYDIMVQDNVADHPNADAEVLDILAHHHPGWQACQYIAENPKTSSETLDFLSTVTPSHHIFEFYKKLICNPKTPHSALARLLNDKDSHWLLADYSTDPDVLDELSKICPAYLKLNIAKNPNTPAETLNYLLKARSKEVKDAVRNHPNYIPMT